MITTSATAKQHQIHLSWLTLSRTLLRRRILDLPSGTSRLGQILLLHHYLSHAHAQSTYTKQLNISEQLVSFHGIDQMRSIPPRHTLDGSALTVPHPTHDTFCLSFAVFEEGMSVNWSFCRQVVHSSDKSFLSAFEQPTATRWPTRAGI